MEHRFTSLPPDPFMCSSDEKQSRSPLALYSEYQRMDIELRPPHAMPTSHWHGQVEVNVPFDGDVEYLINNEVVRIEKGYITLFWACTPHQLTRPGDCQQMAIFNLPMHLFLSWPLDRELINHVTHGMVIKSLAAQQLSAFEVRRWQQELSHENEQIRQLAIDEIALMLKRLSLAGWQPILVNKTSRTHKNSVSRHAQFYVSQMLEFIAAHYDQALTVNAVAEHVKLNPNYAMGVFQRVMQQTMKQYITAMRINHVRALLSDTDKTILDIALTAGFRSSSRFYSTFTRYVGDAGVYRCPLRPGADRQCRCRAREAQPELCDGGLSAGDAADHEAVHYRHAYQSCAGAAERYRQDHPRYCPYRRFSLQQSLLQHFYPLRGHAAAAVP